MKNNYRKGQYIYILFLENGELYVGSTWNIKRRINNHINGYSHLKTKVLFAIYEDYSEVSTEVRLQVEEYLILEIQPEKNKRPAYKKVISEEAVILGQEILDKFVAIAKMKGVA